MLKIYNTLTKQKHTFKPINAKNIGIYVCGMTVYDRCHIGHARIMVVFDIVVRHLRRNFNSVTYVRNITDIDDKIIKRAAKRKENIKTLTNKFIDLMHKDEIALGNIAPDIEPRATENINEMLYLIQKLIDKGLAYNAKDGDVYYSVDAFDKYGDLSVKNIDELLAGNRVEIDKNKRNDFDFVLWKIAKENEPYWHSPWGNGRPGWHLECSAMSNHYLGNHFDIHGGGVDLVFPHHENEIAQSEGANDCPLANIWMHAGFVNIVNNNGISEKMSKSLNNFFTIDEVLKKYNGEIIRYFILSSHYRSPLNYSEINLKLAKTSLTKLYLAIRNLGASDSVIDEISMRYDYKQRFNMALNDDFNTPIALSVLFELAKTINSTTDKDLCNALAGIMRTLGSYLGILQDDKFLLKGIEISDKAIKKKIKQRQLAKDNLDFIAADKIRDELAAIGVILEDNLNSTTYRRK